MAENTIRRACPICSEPDTTTRRSVDGWDLATCDCCGFLYAPVIRANTATEMEFPPNYEPVSRARHRQVHTLLESLLHPGETVVDVGAGFGELGLVTTQSERFSYIGFEPSTSVSAVARSRGIDLRAELFGDDSLSDPVGAVVLDNVIEHLADPVGLMSTCVEHLRVGGILVVIVPNRRDLRQVAPVWRDANHWIPPEHVNYFTHSSLRRVLESLNLEMHPFGFAALGRSDWKYWPRAAGEAAGLFPFGLNVYGRRRMTSDPTTGQ